MQIGNIPYVSSQINLSKGGNALPQGKDSQQANFSIELSTANKSPTASNATLNAPSSIEELELYFQEKLTQLRASGEDTSSILELREKIRSAAENRNGDSPPLPTVLEHPYGGKVLANVHLSFGHEIKGDLQNFSDNAAFIHLFNGHHLTQDTGNKSEVAEIVSIYKNNSSDHRDELVMRNLAERIDPMNMNRNEAREIALTLGLTKGIEIDNAFLLQSMVLVNKDGNLQTASETDSKMNERFNMFDAINGSIQFHKAHGLATNHLEEALAQLEKLKTYRDNPQINLYS